MSYIRQISFISLIVYCLFSLAGCDALSACGTGTPLRMLFIGNSYTYVNDLPGTFQKLACSAGQPVETGMAASGGWTLSQHVESKQTQELLTERKWDLVILQEQSEIPAIPASRELSMYPAVRSLVNEIMDEGAEPLLLLTWGHRDGLPDANLSTYTDMQNSLNNGYDLIADQLQIRVIPVGKVWQTAVDASSPLDLWQGDGSHPEKDGTYLAACVLYAEIFQSSPVDLSYRAGLSKEKAELIQALVQQYYIFSD